MENWRLYEQQTLLEQEFEQFFNEHFTQLDEGPIDWVLEKASTVKDTIIAVIDGIKDWTHDKIVKFVKFMGDKLLKFIKLLRSQGVFKKYKARNEENAVKMLMTNKHIDLAVMIFSAFAKMSGGFVAEKLTQSPKIMRKFLDLLEDPTKIKDVLGDVSEIIEIIKKFIEYRKDKETLAGKMGLWQDFGGLVERLEALR
jgi:hypothetical protein